VSTKFPVYLEDGYTQEGYIAAVPGLFEALRFEFRPIVVAEQSAHYKEEKKFSGPAWARFAADFIARRLLSWSAARQDGAPVPLRGPDVAKIHPALFSRLYSILNGTDASDLDPEWSEAEKEESADYQFEAVRDETTPGAAAAQDREKN